MSALPTVLHVRVVTGQGGGPDKTILRSARYMRDRGYREISAYLRPPRDRGFEALERQAKDFEAELIAIDDSGPLDWKVVGRLTQLCRRERVLVWHGHDYKSNALGLLVRRYWPMRLLTTVHGWVHHTARTPLYYFVDRCCLRWYERVLCVSRDVESAVRGAGVGAHRCQLLENGIEEDRFLRERAPAEARMQLGLRPDAALVGAVGRLAEEKNFDGFLQAVSLVIQSGRAIQAVIVGDGSERRALEQRAAELRIKDRVHFAGHCADVRPWYEAMDIFVLSSLREAMPNVVLEAMATETPVVATRIAGVPDMLGHETSGWLVPPGDAGAMAAGITRLLTDRALRSQFAAAGRSAVLARFSFRERMNRMQQIYDELLQQPQPVARRA
jgi:glycosyltransferase involved in cell wall biosynthesis